MPLKWKWFNNSEPFRWTFGYSEVPEFAYFYLPLWAFVAATLVPTALAWRSDTLATRRAHIGFCAKCGYNLSATAAGVPCPECGAKV
ncbi:MAG: hypothetical protein KF805_05335 [Phycisphaeraceae bacterium]|nr:hypothetical protein [Phycisphaeraceae bacterium]